MIILLYNKLPKNKLIMVKKRDLSDKLIINIFINQWCSANIHIKP